MTQYATRSARMVFVNLYYLNSGDPNSIPKLPVPLPEFELNGDLLVHEMYITSKQGPNRDVTQIVIPEQLVP